VEKTKFFTFHFSLFTFIVYLCSRQIIKESKKMKKSVFMMSLVAAVMFTSCASKKDLEACQQENKSLQANYTDTKEKLAAATTRAASLEEQLKQQEKAYKALQRSLDKSLTNASQNNVSIEKLVDQINESNKYIRHLVEVKSKSDSLNMVLTNNLTRSLSKEELKEVDVQVLKGVVYISLADNMLYKSGSYEINDRAAETLSKIAKIIKDYKDYDVLIEGNTDDVPIKRENIRNNWDLSCLRASSVVQALQNNYGVDPKRLTAGGRGEYNPLQSNSTEVGKQRNRRTQIIITPKLDEFMELIGQAPEESK
jgi:chemotaxis protein MotB